VGNRTTRRHCRDTTTDVNTMLEPERHTLAFFTADPGLGCKAHGIFRATNNMTPHRSCCANEQHHPCVAPALRLEDLQGFNGKHISPTMSHSVSHRADQQYGNGGFFASRGARIQPCRRGCPIAISILPMSNTFSRHQDGILINSLTPSGTAFYSLPFSPRNILNTVSRQQSDNCSRLHI
jgi:hypothetical protein